ncbi:hypothetical protein PIB30_074218 [Stylosanthes scabra]|uniref:Ubiquitin-like protease family profile domain-containing protein n=1 Tax=Stylosanthes scabra TaxID=79078 RepID=A0ABU6XRG9_9FABA|nr:hypothetical protein [Stylosanthes scabra]
MFLTEVDGKEGKTGDATKGASVEDSAVEHAGWVICFVTFGVYELCMLFVKGLMCVGFGSREKATKKGSEDAEEVLTVGVIKGVYRQIRELLHNTDEATRRKVEAQGSDMEKMKGKLDCHNRILEVLWADYVERRKAGKRKVVAKKPSGRRGRPKAAAKESDMPELDVDEIMKKLCGEEKGAWKSYVDVQAKCDDSGHADGKNKSGPCSSVRKPPLKRKLQYRIDNYSAVAAKAAIGLTVYDANTPGFLDGGDFPSCIEVSFRPPIGVSEVLVPDDHSRGDRRTLWSLRPGKEVEDDVINVLARNLTVSREDKRMWWLPMTFNQFALNPSNHCPITFDYMKRAYMGKADQMKKIFIPLNLNRHWYLMIIDILDDSLIYLDSRKCNEQREARVKQMKDVADFIGKMLLDREFYDVAESIPPAVGTYDIHEPVVNQQASTFRDCGVWVAQWMELSYLWGAYDLDRVNNETWMRLAIDLVMSELNPKRMEVLDLAAEHWDSCVKGASAAGNSGHVNSSGKTKKVVSVDSSTSSQSFTI